MKILVILLFIIFVPFYEAKADNIITNFVNPVSYFTGREEEIEFLENHLSKDGQTIAVVGMLGIGKTQLVRQYSHNKKDKYNIIWFIDCEIELSQQFLNLAKEINEKICLHGTKCKIIENIEYVKDNVLMFLNSQKKWLLVFDNITINNSEKIKAIIPKTHNGHIITCSQDKNTFATILPLSTFKREVSERLVQKISPDFSQEQVTALANIFSDYPILLVKGSIFLLNNKYLTIEDYQEIKQFSDTDSEIQKHIKLSIEKLDDKTKELLLEIALINSKNFSKDLLTKLHGVDDQTLTKNLYTLVRFALIEDKRLVFKDPRFEMHDVVRSTILSFHSSDTIRKAINKISYALTTVFPEHEVYKHHALLDSDDTIRSNIEMILQNAEYYKSDIYEIIGLRKSLAFIYTDQLDYPKWNEMKQWLDIKESNQEINLHKMNNSQKSIYGWYKIYQSMYELFVAGNAQGAEKYLYKALEKAKDTDSKELLFASYMQLVNIHVHSGNIDQAKASIKQIEHLVQTNSSCCFDDLGSFGYVKARLLLLEGKYNESLEEVNHSIKYIKHLPQDQFTAPFYLMKARILLNMGMEVEAYKIANEIYNQSKKYFKYDYRLQERIFTLLASAESSLKMHKESIEHIDAARKIFIDNSNKYNDPLTSIVEGDIAIENENCSESIAYYQVAEDLLNRRYNHNMKVDIISILYTKIVKAALKCNDHFLGKQYIEKHENIFEDNNMRNIELYKELIKSLPRKNLYSF